MHGTRFGCPVAGLGPFAVGDDVVSLVHVVVLVVVDVVSVLLGGGIFLSGAV